MAIAQAIESGRRAANVDYQGVKMVDPGQLLTSITSAIASGRRARGGNRISNLSPKKIHAAAASAAVAQEELEMRRENQRIAREKWEWEKENIRRQRVRQGEADERAWQEGWDKSMKAIGDRYDTEMTRIRGRQTEEQKDFRAQRSDDYYAMLNSLANDRPEGIINFFAKYGAPDQKITDIQFAAPMLDNGKPNPDAGKIMVTYQDGQNEEWQSKDQLVQGLIGWANPDVQDKLSKQSLEKRKVEVQEREATVKEQEELRKGKTAEWEQSGGIPAKELTKLKTEGVKTFQEGLTNGTIEEGTLFEEWFPSYVETVTGKPYRGAAPAAPAAPGAASGKKSETGIMRSTAPTWAPKKPHPEAKWAPNVRVPGMTDGQGNWQSGGWVIKNAKGQWIVASHQTGKVRGEVGENAGEPQVPKVRGKIRKPGTTDDRKDSKSKKTTAAEDMAQIEEETEGLTQEEKASADLKKIQEKRAKAREGGGYITYRKKNKSGETMVITKDLSGKQISAIPERAATKSMKKAAATTQGQEAAKTAAEAEKVASPVKTRTEAAEATAAKPKEGTPAVEAPKEVKKEESAEATVPKEGGAEQSVAKAETGTRDGGNGKKTPPKKTLKKKKKKKKKGK